MNEIGIIGLGVMGQNLLFNIADQGFNVAGFDKDPEKVKDLKEKVSQELKETKNKGQIYAFQELKEFLESLQTPRAILLLVPAGIIVDKLIQDLLPHLEQGDLMIDAGNSYFKDTDRRSQDLTQKGLQWMGIGISGGAMGARFGPSIMPGGSLTAYDRIQPVLRAISAKVQGEPCVTYLGPGSAGHFVKMVHNGIEYGIMQLIAETYDLMKRGWGLDNDQLSEVYERWNQGELNSFLIEITSQIFKQVDNQTGERLIDKISDVASQKGTGLWTAQTAMELQVPIPSIDAAVNLRDLSTFKQERLKLSSIYESIKPHFAYLAHPKMKESYESKGGNEAFLNALSKALYAAIIMVFSQGMSLLSIGSKQYDYQLDLEAIAKIWRGGCIIRAALLEDIAKAYRKNSSLPNLLLDSHLSKKVIEYQESLRGVVSTGIALGLPVPGLMASLAYLDDFRSGWLPSNLIQAQRDFFGSHGFQRLDAKGQYHTDWNQKD